MKTHKILQQKVTLNLYIYIIILLCMQIINQQSHLSLNQCNQSMHINSHNIMMMIIIMYIYIYIPI